MKTAVYKTVLLLIDVQESFRARPYWQTEDLPAFLANTQLLIDRCQARGIPVLQVFHQEPGEDRSNPFHPASGLIRTIPEITVKPDAVFYKEVHSALYAKGSDGATLEQWLREHGVEEVLVTGIRTEQCCETTTRHASDAGFKVSFATDATLTFPMQARSGRRYSTADIRERTELVLDGRFARVITASEAVA
jgi:nicotinamidase-related amidase